MPVQPSFSQQVFVVPEDALEHRHVDVLAVEVLVPVAVVAVAGLHHHVGHRAERVQQVEEDLEEAAAGDGRHQHGDRGAVLLVAVAVVPVALGGHDVQAVGGPDGVGEHEVAVACYAQVRFQLLFR